MVDSSNQRFDTALDAYAVAEAEVQAATARRDAARRAVMRARPTGVTSVEVTRRLKAAAADADKLVQIMVRKDDGAPRSIVVDHLDVSALQEAHAFLERAVRSSGVSSRM